MNILYATDGSTGALAGAHFLRALPLGEGDRIRIVSVVEPETEQTEEAEAALSAARTLLCEPQPGAGGTTMARISQHVRRGHAAKQIVEEAEKEPADLLVVGTHGRSALARFFVGSTAERIARHAPCPVLLARPLRVKLDTILLGVDASECSEHAAAWLQRFPLPPGCTIRLANVAIPENVVPPALLTLLAPISEDVDTALRRQRQEASERLNKLAAEFAAARAEAVIGEAHSDNPALDGLSVLTEVRADDPASGLLDLAEEHRADLIVVGSHGLSGIDRFLLGSVSEKVLRHAPCSVLVVRQTRGA